MCGIFGAINPCAFFEFNRFAEFRNLTDLVHYRGPDASGYKALNIKKKESSDNIFDVFFGHRRLSIIDLSDAADQPFTTNGEVWIVYNGEVFNYIELREELRERGHTFNTNSDTEVILKVYEEYTETGFDKLNGMWAFAIVDLKTNKVILSRDRFSIKPLYYTWVSDREFYFASEIKQLLPLLEKKDINQDMIFRYLNQGLVCYNDETFFRQIRKIKPKSNLIINMNSGTIEEKIYWNYSTEEVVSSPESIERFRDIFTDSVKIRLRSDVNVGTLLSGGLDSSTIATVADNQANGKLATYSVISKDYPQYSEEKYVDILCKERGIRNHKIPFTTDNLLPDLDRVVYHNDEPFISLSTLAQYKMLEKIKQETDITVLLSGQGADEILMGYMKYFYFYLKTLVKRGDFKEALTQILFSTIHRTVLWQFNLGMAMRYVPFLHRFKGKPYMLAEGHTEAIWQCNQMRDRQILDLDKYSVPALTHYEDRNSMAHSLEIRLPFLDYRLVNFALNCPDQLKINRGWTKYILREAFPELPSPIRWRRDKQGFITPERIWLKTKLNPLITRSFQKSKLADMGIINTKLFLDYYEKFRKGDRAIWHTDISRVLIAELWAKRFW